jgi:acyl-CoA thioesterase-1
MRFHLDQKNWYKNQYRLCQLTLLWLISLSFFSVMPSALAENSTKLPQSKTILIVGDSLSAAYGIPQNQGWAMLLQNRLKQEKYDYHIMNASVSGETTSGGASRIDKLLKQSQPSIVILALGANDGLRGLPTEEMQRNLQNIISKSQTAKAKVLLLGMKIPPNYGLDYTQAFSQTYQTLSRANRLPLVPFMLENIAVNTTLIQDDGLHPNAKAQPILLNNVWPSLRVILKK